MTVSGQEWTISAGAHTATVVEVGAGLLRYQRDGVDITCSYGDDELPPKGCGTTLVPWPNRIRGGRYDFDGRSQQLALSEPDSGNAIHGLGRWVRWVPVHETDDSVTLRFDVPPQKGYPHLVRTEVTYTVDPDVGLVVTLGARNLGRTRAPFGAGSHPYLATYGHALDDVTLHLPARSALVMDDRQLPVGTRTLSGKDDYRHGRRLHKERFDAAFTDLETGQGRGAARIETPGGGATLWFDETFRYLQVFTVDHLTNGRAGVAIEPMTCAPDAFNSGAGLIVLEPDDVWSGRWGITPL